MSGFALRPGAAETARRSGIGLCRAVGWASRRPLVFGLGEAFEEEGCEEVTEVAVLACVAYSHQVCLASNSVPIVQEALSSAGSR